MRSKFIIVFLFCLSTGYAQFDRNPNTFPVKTEAELTDEVYSSYGDVDVRIPFSAVRRLMVPGMKQLTFTPNETGNTQNLGSLVQNPGGDTFYIGYDGIAYKVGTATGVTYVPGQDISFDGNVINSDVTLPGLIDDNGGVVGIGTTNPSHSLQVIGTTRTDSLIIGNETGVAVLNNGVVETPDRAIVTTGIDFRDKPLITEIDPINDHAVIKKPNGEVKEVSIKELIEAGSLLHIRGVVYFDYDTETWKLLDDATHANENITSVTSTPSGDGFSVNFNNNHVGEVIYADIGQDDILVQKGISGGISGGLTVSVAKLWYENGLVGLVQYNGSSWEMPLEASSINIVSDLSWVNGELQLTHSPLEGRYFGFQATPFRTHLNVVSSGLGSTQTKIRFYNTALNEQLVNPTVYMKAFLLHPGKAKITNEQIAQLSTGQMNFWFSAYCEGSVQMGLWFMLMLIPNLFKKLKFAPIILLAISVNAQSGDGSGICYETVNPNTIDGYDQRLSHQCKFVYNTSTLEFYKYDVTGDVDVDRWKLMASGISAIDASTFGNNLTSVDTTAQLAFDRIDDLDFSDGFIEDPGSKVSGGSLNLGGNILNNIGSLGVLGNANILGSADVYGRIYARGNGQNIRLWKDGTATNDGALVMSGDGSFYLSNYEFNRGLRIQASSVIRFLGYGEGVLKTNLFGDISTGSIYMSDISDSYWVNTSGDLHNSSLANVGIGIAAPLDKLHVNGNVRVSGGNGFYVYDFAGNFISNNTPSQFYWGSLSGSSLTMQDGLFNIDTDDALIAVNDSRTLFEGGLTLGDPKDIVISATGNIDYTATDWGKYARARFITNNSINLRSLDPSPGDGAIVFVVNLNDPTSVVTLKHADVTALFNDGMIYTSSGADYVMPENSTKMLMYDAAIKDAIGTPIGGWMLIE